MRWIWVGLVLSGCVSTKAVMLVPTAQFSPTCTEAITFYTSAEKVPQPYVEIAMLRSKGADGFTSEEGMANSQRQKAAKLGATGIIFQTMKEPGAGDKAVGALFGTAVNRKGTAIAVFVPADTAKAFETCRSSGG